MRPPERPKPQRQKSLQGLRRPGLRVQGAGLGSCTMETALEMACTTRRMYLALQSCTLKTSVTVTSLRYFTTI